MSDEKKRILKMLEAGIIKSDEALDLLEALNGDAVNEAPKKKKKGKVLRVRVDATGDMANSSKKGGKAKVKVNIPLDIAKKIGSIKGIIPKEAKKSLEEEGINIDEFNLKELIEAFEDGQLDEDLVDIEAGDGEDKAVVKVYVD